MPEEPVTLPAAVVVPPSAHLKLERGQRGGYAWSVSITAAAWGEAFAQLQAAEAALRSAYGSEAPQ